MSAMQDLQLTSALSSADGSLGRGSHEASASTSDMSKTSSRSSMGSSSADYGAGDLVFDLVAQMQVLASLLWLEQFKVLPCIPPVGSVPVDDVAEMAGVPASQLCRVIALTATVGVLHEPTPGLVAHTLLSSQFLTKPALSDAIGFVGDIAFPAAHGMVNASRVALQTLDVARKPCAYSCTSRGATTLAADSHHQPRLRRQTLAFQQVVLQHVLANEVGIVSALTRILDRAGPGPVTVVQCGCPSDAVARSLVQQWPNLHMVVQLSSWGDVAETRPASSTGNGLQYNADRVAIQRCFPGAPQMIKDGDFYLAHLPPPSLLQASSEIMSQTIAVLRAHFDVLRFNPSARLILVVQGLLGTAAPSTKAEGAARVYDLFLMQMGNDSQATSLDQVDQLLSTVQDAAGRLVILRKEVADKHPTLAMEVGFVAN